MSEGLYLIDPEVGAALETWLKIIKPSINSAEIKALLTSKFRALKLESLPMKKALFIFDTALINTQKAIPMIDAARNGSWIPLIVKRMNAIDDHDFQGWNRLRKLMIYLTELEAESISQRREKHERNGQSDRAALGESGEFADRAREN